MAVAEPLAARPAPAGDLDFQVGQTEWERLLADVSGATVFHTWAWKRFLESRGRTSQYVLALDRTGAAVAGFPFFVVRFARIFSILWSLPGCDIGDPLFTKSADEQHTVAALDRFLRGKRRWRLVAARLKLTNERLCQHLVRGGLAADTSKGLFVLDLEQRPPERIWEEVFTRGRGERTEIRKLEREGFEFRVVTDRTAINDLYRLHNLALAHLGMRPNPLTFYEHLWDYLYPEHLRVANISVNGAVVCSSAFLTFRPTQTVHFEYLGFDRDAIGNRAVVRYMAWQTLKWARDNGYRFANLGSTSASTQDEQYHRKGSWGATFIPQYAVTIPCRHPLSWVFRSQAAAPVRALGRVLTQSGP